MVVANGFTAPESPTLWAMICLEFDSWFISAVYARFYILHNWSFKVDNLFVLDAALRKFREVIKKKLAINNNF